MTVAAVYDVSLGPLRFVCPAEAITEQLGEALENVGAVPTVAEPRPRAFRLKLPVRGDDGDTDPRAAGVRLRRQLRQLLENPAWRNQPLFFDWSVDPELSCWLMVGGGELSETEAGVSFGDWLLDLTDCYIAGRPNRARPGRRLELADRRTGLVPRDTRGLIYSTNHATQALPTEPLILPGQATGVTGVGNRALGGIVGPNDRAGRSLWRMVACTDGEAASFTPTVAIAGYDDPGQVRVWDASASTVTLAGNTPVYNGPADQDPTLMGWERVFGDPRTSSASDTPLAIDNGRCRLVWVAGTRTTGGLWIEHWNPAEADGYRRLARVGVEDGTTGPTDFLVTVVELTPERAVVEWRSYGKALRAILQRGWRGPRLEVFADDGGTARLEIVGAGVAVTAATAPSGSPAWVRTLTAGTHNTLIAKGTDDIAEATIAANAGNYVQSAQAGVAYTRTRALVVQLDSDDAGAVSSARANALGSLAVADARPVPVLVTR